MKTFLLALSFLFVSSFLSTVKAQNTPDIHSMYKQYLAISDSLKDLYGQYKALQQDVNVSNNLLEKITDKDLTDAKTKYEKNVESIKKTTYFVESMNKSLGALEASLSTTEYFAGISALNNPTNDELGFKLEDEILGLVDKQILSKAKKLKSGSKFKRIVANIINNPITNFVVSNIPAVNSISSVMNLVNGLAINTDELQPEDLRNFQNELKKYVAHYEQLAKANKELNDNVSNLNLKADALEKLLQDFITNSTIELYQEDKTKIDQLNKNQLIAQYYNYANVDKHIGDIEKKYVFNGKILYSKLTQDSRLVYSVVGRQKIAFMSEQLEQLVNEYLSALDQYHINVVATLEKAKEISDEDSKIDQKIRTLNEQYKQVKQKFLNNVDLTTTQKRLAEIPRY